MSARIPEWDVAEIAEVSSTCNSSFLGSIYNFGLQGGHFGETELNLSSLNSYGDVIYSTEGHMP